MDEKIAKKLELALELIGSAVVFTMVEIIALYLLLAIDLFHRYNVFLIFRRFFEEVLFTFDVMYRLLMDIMYVIFGESYLHVVGFNNVFKLVFLVIFLCNLAYFSAVKYLRLKNESS